MLLKVLISIWFPDKWWSRMLHWNLAIYTVFLKIFLQCDLWHSLRSSFWVKTFAFFFSKSYFYNKFTDDQQQSLIIKSIFPLMTFLVSAFTKSVQVCMEYILFRYIMKPESFSQVISTLNISRAFPTCFHQQKMWGRIIKALLHLRYSLGFTEFISWANPFISSWPPPSDNRWSHDYILLC